MKQISPIQFFKKLRWLDGQPLLNVVEPYRQRLFERANATDENGIPLHNLGLFLRAKKNWKTGDLVLESCYRLFAYRSPGGNQVYTLCNDEDQAGDDLELGKRFIQANPILKAAAVIKQNVIERKDGNGFWEILPAGDVVGTHGKTYSLAGFDEVHGYRNWDILEAMQLDPTRPDAMMWITSGL